MKICSLFMASVALAAAALFSSCAKKAPCALIPIVDKMNLDLAQMAEDNPMFLSEASADLDSVDNALNVNVAFSDSVMDVDAITDQTIKYYTAMQLKANPGKELDDFLNTMSAEKTEFRLNLSDVYGHSRTCATDAAQLKQLFRLSPMQLNFIAVKDNVLALFERKCEFYRKAANARECSFTVSNGFAQYTLVFDRPTAFANLNQGSLKGRYLHFLQPIYEDMQAFRYPVEEMLKSLQIDGYRFVYKAAGAPDGEDLRVAIPWREI